MYQGENGTDSDTDEDADEADKTGVESLSQWVKKP